MRLTSPLSMPRMWYRLRSFAWYKAKKRHIQDDPNINRLIEAGYNPVDALEYVKPMSPLYMDYDSLQEPPSRFPQPPKWDRSHPDWHDEICKVMDDSVFPIEGLQQALAFTKAAQMSDNLPQTILERAKAIEITNQEDDRAKKVVQQAYLWDAYLDKLPKLKDLDNLWFEPTREYGIPWKRSSQILMSNFVRIIESKVPLDLAFNRMLCPEEEFRVNCQRHGQKVQFKLNPLFHVMSTSPMKPVLSKAEVEDTRQLPVTDIYPFQSTANLEDCNIYDDSDHFAVPANQKFGNIHTSIFSHHIPGSHTHIHPRWNDDRFMGTTILYNFATALIMAKKKFGPDVSGDLPEPITTQVIHLTRQDFQFSVFQLNTLNLEDVTSTTVKNNVWITDKMKLYTRIENKLGREHFEGYNPDILKIIMALYLTT